MLLRRFLGVLGAVVVMCVALVWLHGERVLLSYRLSRLTGRQAELKTQYARLTSLVSKLETPEALDRGVRRFSLELVSRSRATARRDERFRLASRIYEQEER